MKKLMHLVMIQLGSVLRTTLVIGRKRNGKQNALMGGLVLFCIVLSAVSFFYSYMIGTGLLMVDSIRILPALMMAVTSMIVLVTTVLKIKGTVFGFRDYDMVMSLPIKTGTIIISRLMILYLVNLLFTLIVMIPMMISYGILAKPGVYFYVYGFITVLMIPLLPITIASVFGTLIAVISSRFRHTNFFSIILSLVILICLVVLPTALGDSEEELLNIGRALTDKVEQIYPLAGLYLKAVCEYQFTAFLVFVLVSIASFLLFSLIVGGVFKKINTIIMSSRTRSNYKIKEMRQDTPFKALYLKELRRYFSSTIYVLNTGFGVVLLTVASIAMIFVDINKIIGNGVTPILSSTVPIYISFCIVASCTTMCSISLEGKSFWIMKSLPVTPNLIMKAKIGVNLTVLAPAILDTILISVILGINLTRFLITLLIVISCAFFISIWGMVLNLIFPNFTWTTEAVVVKQSIAAMIAIFSGIAMVGIQAVLVYLLSSAITAYLLYFTFIFAVDVLLYRILMTWGARRFALLS